MRQSADNVTWQAKGCGLKSTADETRRHQAYFAAFRDIHMRIFALKASGKTAEAAELAAEYNGRTGGIIPCLCGCGQKPVF